MIEPDDHDKQAADIIRTHGPNAIPHLVALIEKAIKRGDDGEVERLDHILTSIEKAAPYPSQ